VPLQEAFGSYLEERGINEDLGVRPWGQGNQGGCVHAYCVCVWGGRDEREQSRLSCWSCWVDVVIKVVGEKRCREILGAGVLS
jgi:hypothetical protein